MALTYQQLSSLLTQNWVAISNKKPAGDCGCRSDKRGRDLAFQLHDSRGGNKARDTLSLHNPFFQVSAKALRNYSQ